MGRHTQSDDVLFEALSKKKKRRKRKIIITVVVVLLVAAAGAFVGVNYLRRQVREQFASSTAEVLSYEVTTGTISTVVSGSGTLSEVDLESVTVPGGVEIGELLVSRNDTVSEGDVLATVDMTSVLSAMSALQAEISTLDESIAEAEGDAVASSITTGVSGRVKVIYAQADDDVAEIMVEYGALALLSLDGYMAVDIADTTLAMGDEVTVVLSDESELDGSVELSANGTATILVSDKTAAYGEEVTVLSDEGVELGSGTLYIHEPLAITGFAGTVSSVVVDEDEKVSAGDKLFKLTDTEYSVNYDLLLRERSELEEELLELLSIQRDGAILAPVSGSVYSVSGTTSGSSAYELVSLSRDEEMSVTISVDESDILSLELGQTAQVTVSSVSEDAFMGSVTEIDTSGTSGSYSAVVTLEKTTGMLSGMTASVSVIIEGVEDALLIPIEALHQTSTGAYVYTSYDEETEEYGGQVDVVTGLSNSNYVEIKSGLSEGDVVYYTESVSVTSMFSGGMGGDFGGMGGDSGGDMPSGSGGGSSRGDAGGDMPSGGSMPGGSGGGQGGGG